MPVRLLQPIVQLAPRRIGLVPELESAHRAGVVAQLHPDAVQLESERRRRQRILDLHQPLEDLGARVGLPFRGVDLLERAEDGLVFRLPLERGVEHLLRVGGAIGQQVAETQRERGDRGGLSLIFGRRDLTREQLRQLLALALPLEDLGEKERGTRLPRIFVDDLAQERRGGVAQPALLHQHVHPLDAQAGALGRIGRVDRHLTEQLGERCRRRVTLLAIHGQERLPGAPVARISLVQGAIRRRRQLQIGQRLLGQRRQLEAQPPRLLRIDRVGRLGRLAFVPGRRSRVTRVERQLRARVVCPRAHRRAAVGVLADQIRLVELIGPGQDLSAGAARPWPCH